jgi:hypothetical protein
MGRRGISKYVNTSAQKQSVSTSSWSDLNNSHSAIY